MTARSINHRLRGTFAACSLFLAGLTASYFIVSAWSKPRGLLPDERIEVPVVLSAPRRLEFITDFQEDIDLKTLRSALLRLEPFSPKPMPSVVMATHALRLWGNTESFSEEAIMPAGFHFPVWRFSAPTLLEFLTNHEQYRKYFSDADPLLIPTDYGITVKPKVDNFLDQQINRWPDCEAHVDKVISVFGEIGIPSSFPVLTEKRKGNVRNMLIDSSMRFTMSQEKEFSCKAFLFYYSLPAKWRGKSGQTTDLNEVLESMCEERTGSGCCIGTHVPQVIALALAIDKDKPFLGKSRSKLEDYIRRICRLLEDTQLENGAWPSNWSNNGDHQVMVAIEGEPAVQIRVTGHHLEWIAHTPSEFRPSKTCVTRSILFLQNSLAKLEGDAFYHNYTALTHAARALVLLSGRTAGEILHGDY